MQLDPRAIEFERRLLACPTLPTLPATALQILQLCQAEELDLQQISEAIATDAALSARVLRMANSAALGLRGQVSTLHRAVTLLGANAITSIALSFSLLRGRRIDARDGFDRRTFWKRTVYAGLAGRILAEVTTSTVDKEESFIAALLQDLGMLALAEVFRERYAQLWLHAAGDHEALAALERDVWGVDHAYASALLARAWHLPVGLERAISSSHDEPPREGSARSNSSLARCVALSGRFADVWIAPAGIETALALESLRTHFESSSTALDAVLARMALAVPEGAIDFEMDLGGQARVDEVRAEAERLLAHRELPRESSGARRAAWVGPPSRRANLSTPMDVAFAYAQAQAEPIALMVISCEPRTEATGARLVNLVQSCLRSIDLIGEDGHGGILALLPGTDADETRNIAEAILARAHRSLEAIAYIGVAASIPATPAASLEALQATATSAWATASSRPAPGIEVALSSYALVPGRPV